MGIPIIGCNCPVCSSSSPYNKRLRSSALCMVNKQNILIDCGPDFRQQALQHRINHLDGVIFTHAHNDHTAGIDDLKIYCFRAGKPLECLLSRETEAELKKRFYYMFDEAAAHSKLTPKFNMHFLESNRGNVIFQQLPIRYFSYEQMGMRVHGFRFGNLAYISDIKIFPDTIFEDLQRVDILVLSALRFSPSPMHFSIDEAIEFSIRSRAKQTWLMHIAHELDHGKTGTYLPKNIQMAYDGLILDFQIELEDL